MSDDSQESHDVGPYRLVLASIILIVLPLCIVLSVYSGLFSQLLPLLCDPNVELDATAVDEPPADADHVYGDESPYLDFYVRQAVTRGIYRRCGTTDEIQFENWVEFGGIDSRDRFYYLHAGQWYRVDARIVPSDWANR